MYRPDRLFAGQNQYQNTIVIPDQYRIKVGVKNFNWQVPRVTYKYIAIPNNILL